MSKATTLKEAAVAVVKHDTTTAKNLRQDREWLWLVGDYREDEATREVLRETGYRFSARGHELESGETAHWYFAASLKGKASRRATVKVKRAAVAASKPSPVNPDLFCKDADAEFAAMFG